MKNLEGKKIGYFNIIDDITEIKCLEKLSITDRLTELYNRKYFDFILQKEYKSSRWKQMNFALMIIDDDEIQRTTEMITQAAESLKIPHKESEANILPFQSVL